MGPLLALGALAALPPLLDGFGAGFWIVVLSRGLILAIAAMGLQFILGRGGMVCFGYAAFMGIGAYAVGIPYAEGVGEGLIVLPLAMAAAAAFAALTGLIALRTRGVYFIMITLAFGQMAFYCAMALSDYGGDDGLTLWRRSTVAGADLLRGDWRFYYVCLGCAALVWAGLAALGRSRFGRLLDAARQNEDRAEALGFDVRRARLLAYALSGAIGGLAGALLANHAEFVSPAYMGWHRSGELMVMVVLGGVASLSGAATGALLLAGLEEWLSELTLHWRIILGAGVVLMALYARGGIAGALGRLRR
jgi:branched-chain amino acid transport system permease protein